ncbi:MAG: hypothetical protein IJ693_04220 [Bacteroidaceae bacterium]|nr:hypothetical protein [Bacteroidaceae bacterium]
MFFSVFTCFFLFFGYAELKVLRPPKAKKDFPKEPMNIFDGQSEVITTRAQELLLSGRTAHDDGGEPCDWNEVSPATKVR